MRRALLAFALLASCLGCTQEMVVSDESAPVEIDRHLKWLAVGQSNMVIPYDFTGEDDLGAKIALAGTTDARSITEVGGVSEVPARFAIEMTRALEEPVTVYSGGFSGTGIDCWLPPPSGTEGTFSAGACWESRVEPIYGTVIDGIIWWQGESDAADKMTGIVYAKKLKTFIETLRGFFDDPTLPFILVVLEEIDPSICLKTKGELCDLDSWREIQNAQRGVAATVSNVIAIDISDITYGDSHPVNSYPEVSERLTHNALQMIP